MMTIKSIGYAFATSTYAKRLGAYETGCYFVEVKALEQSALVSLASLARDFRRISHTWRALRRAAKEA